MDSDTTIARMKELVDEFVQDREWAKFHTPKSLSMAISSESLLPLSLLLATAPLGGHRERNVILA